jgi:molecular chaperone GrpE (heat shock protein)
MSLSSMFYYFQEKQKLVNTITELNQKIYQKTAEFETLRASTEQVKVKLYEFSETCGVMKRELDRSKDNRSKLMDELVNKQILQIIELNQLLIKARSESTNPYVALASNKLRTSLAKCEVQEFRPNNEPYNFEEHEIVQDQGSSVQTNITDLKIDKVIEPGFKRGNSVLVKAKVTVL